MAKKGYWIGRVDVNDADAYQAYIDANGKAFAEFGARFIIRGGDFETLEGSARSRNVVIEFPSYEAAMACYRSPAYEAAKAFRLPVSTADVIVIEGVDDDA